MKYAICKMENEEIRSFPIYNLKAVDKWKQIVDKAIEQQTKDNKRVRSVYKVIAIIEIVEFENGYSLHEIYEDLKEAEKVAANISREHYIYDFRSGIINYY